MQEASRCKPLKLAKKPPAREEAENLLPEQEKLLDSLNLSINRVMEKLRLLLEIAARDSNAKPPRSHVIVIRAPWGFGKTHYGKQVLPRLARRVGLAYVYRNFEAVIDSTLERLRSMGTIRYDEYGGDVTRVARKEICRLFEEAAAEADKVESKAALLFLDEIEAVLEAAQRHGGGVVSLRAVVANILFNELLAALRQLLHSETETIYRVAAGKVHVVLATTPETYATIMDVARRLGIGGRFARRIDVVTLLPLSKTDTLLLVRTLLRDYYGLPEGSWSEAIVNPIHVVSGGNPGIVMRILNALICEAATECRTLYGDDCVCSLNDPVLLTRLMSRIELPYTPRGGLEKMINPDIARFVLEEARHGSATLANLTAFLEPLDYDSIIAYEVLLANYGLRFYRATLYQGSTVDVTALLEAAARVLADSSSGVSFSDARDAIAEILHITNDGNHALLLPAELSDLAELGLIFANRGLRVSLSAVRDIVALVEEEAGKRGLIKREVWALRPTSLPILYPPAAVKATPFIRDPEAAARLYREVLELRNQIPQEYARLVIEGFNIIMAQLDVLERGERPTASTKLDLQVEMYGSLYRVPAYIELYQQRHPLYSLRPSDPDKPLVRLRLITPPGARPPEPREDAHAVVDVELTPGDAEVLAALAYAVVRKPDEYLDKLDISVLRDLQRRYSETLEAQHKRVAEHFVAKGIAVPSFLYGGHNELTTPERLLNAYRILLLVSTNAIVNPEEAVDTLFAVYRIRPYKSGRTKDWCGTEVPSVLALDLEPDDHRAYYSLERKKRYLSWLREQVEKMLETAEHNMLAKKVTEGRYKLTPHPIEKRLGQLQMKRKKTLEDYFLYPDDPGQERQARRLLRDFFLRLLTARREAVTRPKQGDRERLLHLAAGIREAAEKLMPCNIRLGDFVAIVLFKEKGAKVLEPSTIAEVAEKLYDISSRNHLALEFIHLLERYRDLYTKVGRKIRETLEDYRRAAQEVTRLLDKINRTLQKIAPNVKLEAVGDLATLINRETPCIALKAALSSTEELLNEVKRRQLKDLEARYGELVQNLRFYNCDNPYMFAPILYFLDKELKRLPNPQDHKKKLEEALYCINEATRRIEELPKELRQEALQAVRRQLPEAIIAISDPGQLLQLAKKILEAIGEIERNYEKCSELRRKAEDVYGEIEEVVKRIEEKSKEVKDFQSRLTRLLASTPTYHQEYIVEAQIRIEKLAHEADAALSEIREIWRRVKKLSRSISDTPCTQIETLEVIVERLANIAEQTETLEAQVARILNDIKRIHRDVAEKLMEPLGRLETLRMRIEKMLSRTQDIVIATTVRSCLEDYERIKGEYIDILELKQDPPANGLEVVIADAEKTLKKAYETLRESIVGDVGKEAYRILEALLEELPRGDMSLHELVHVLASRTGLPPETVLAALYKLDRKNYIRVKTTL